MRAIAIAYIDIMRAMPLLVMLILVYYALPFVGITLDPFSAALWAISLVGSAYAAEIFRAGIQAIPRGQVEAAQALGLSYWRQMGDVVLPQALKIVVPPLTNNAISLIKDTALASVVAMPELLKQATQQQSFAANPTPLVGAGLLYSNTAAAARSIGCFFRAKTSMTRPFIQLRATSRKRFGKFSVLQ